MTDRELMQQALDALANFDLDVRLKVMPALRARLEQPKQTQCWKCRGRGWYTCGASDMNLKCPECGGEQ